MGHHKNFNLIPGFLMKAGSWVVKKENDPEAKNGACQQKRSISIAFVKAMLTMNTTQ